MEKAQENIVTEYATVVFCDVVGFSNHLDIDQFQLINSLHKRVSRLLDKHISYIGHSPDILYLPTGDGMAAVFLTPSRFSEALPFSLLDDLVEWIRTERVREERVELRIGVHYGPINRITVNRSPNVCGATINICQRVMDAARPNQALISEDAFKRYRGIIQREYNCSPDPLKIIAKHNLPLDVRILSQKNNDILVNDEPYPRHFIEGREERTRFLVERIQEIKKMNDEELERIHVYEQAAFSTFWISQEAIADQDDKMTKEYTTLLVQQQEALNALVEKAGQFRIILDPESRKYSAKAMVARYKALLKWMDDHKLNPKIDWVESTAIGPNHLTISPKFCLEGYKRGPTAGYDLSLIHFDGKKLAEMITSFDRAFNKAEEKEDEQNQRKQGVIDRLTKNKKEWERQIPKRKISQRKKR